MSNKLLSSKFKSFLAVLLYGFCFSSAIASETDLHEIKEYLNTPQLVGSGTLRYLGFKIYDAYYYVNDDTAKGSFALRLEYSRKLQSTDLLKATIKAMEKVGAPQNDLAQWAAFLGKMYPNVEAGNEITAVYIPIGTTIFFYNGKQIGNVNDIEFSKYFFGIWLAPQTNAPNLRRKLLANNCAPNLISTSCSQ
jgi:hypothetical protein